jgi:hypothetical protein
MFKRLFLVFTLVALLAATADAAMVHRGKRGRRLLRRTLLVQKWQNDKLRVYRRYGFPVHRIREEAFGRIREHWTYYEHGVEFIFDEDHNLVKTNKFWPEDRRARIDRYPGY